MAKRRVANRVRDFALYVSLGVARVAAAWLDGAYQARNDLEPGLPLNWIGFAAPTLLVFGDAVRSMRRAWRTPRLWSLLAAALAIQVVVGTLLLWNAPPMSTMVWALLIPLDAFALTGFLHVFLGNGPIKPRAAQR
jgi:hypothetical protein